jgi:hypothetical protein
MVPYLMHFEVRAARSCKRWVGGAQRAGRLAALGRGRLRVASDCGRSCRSGDVVLAFEMSNHGIEFLGSGVGCGPEDWPRAR